MKYIIMDGVFRHSTKTKLQILKIKEKDRRQKLKLIEKKLKIKL